MITFYDQTDKNRIWICDYEKEKEKNAYYRYPIDISDPEHPTIKTNEKDKKRFYVLNELKEIATTLGLDIEGDSRPIITQPNSNMLVFNYTGTTRDNLTLDFDKNGVPFIRHNQERIYIRSSKGVTNQPFTQEDSEKPMITFYDQTDKNRIWICDYVKKANAYYGKKANAYCAYLIDISDPKQPKVNEENIYLWKKFDNIAL